MFKRHNLAALWFLRRRYGKGVLCAAGLDTEIEMLEISGGTLSDSRRLFCSATNTYSAEIKIQQMVYTNHTDEMHRQNGRFSFVALSIEFTFSI